jgi:hypothetical protein
MWEQMSVVSRVSILIWFVSFPVLVVQGLRNRPVPWWVATASLISYGGVLKHEAWRWFACDTRPEIIASLICAGTVILMSIYQVLNPTARALHFLSHKTLKNIFGT